MLKIRVRSYPGEAAVARSVRASYITKGCTRYIVEFKAIQGRQLSLKGTHA